MTKKCYKLKKLSSDMPLASRSSASLKLQSLNKLLKNSSEISEDIVSLLKRFRESGLAVPKYLTSNMKNNARYIKSIFDRCSDLVMREFKIANNPNYSAMLIYLDGMVKQESIEQFIIQKMTAKPVDNSYQPNSKDYVQYLLGIRPEDIYNQVAQVTDSIINSKVILFIDGVTSALTIDFKNPPARNVEQPDTETAQRGPREGFTESLRTNTCLLRKKIKNPNLKMEIFTLGKQTKTNVIICYIVGIVSERVVDEVKKRISKIDVDSIQGATYVEEYIQDSPLAIFPTMFHTEKPDVIAGKLLEGRIAIITDGTPLVLSVPCLFIEFLQTSEDYYLKIIPATINRWIRFLSLFLTIILPGFYVALLSFLHELIPDNLMPTLINSRAGVPLPPMWECFVMLFVYEVLREAGVRMPRVVGSAVSIVGALVLGQAAVEAGLVSTPTVVVIGFTAIASLTITSPEMNMSLIFPRFLFLFLGGTLGMLGLANGLMIFLLSLISKRSFGVPYMGPLAPLVAGELKDVAIRAPLWSMLKRPQLITWKKSVRKKPRP